MNKDIELLKDTLENSNLHKSNKNLYWSVWKLINAIEKQGVD